MKKILFAFLAIASLMGVRAQDFDRYTYYLVSDSIFEAPDYTYLDRDTMDVYGIIPLTGSDQFIQITGQPACVLRYDAQLDSVMFLYAYSVVYSTDQSTGEREYWKGTWNPKQYSDYYHLGWNQAKDREFPYCYLWWTAVNYSAPDEYYAFDIEPGMYQVKLEKETMPDEDPIISFSKMDELNPIPPGFDYPCVTYYRHTKHTSTSYGSGSGYSKYGSLYNYSAFTMLYSLTHSGNYSSSTSTYYTWDYFYTFGIGSSNLVKTGPFKGYYFWDALSNVYKDHDAILFHLPNDGLNTYGLQKSDDFDTRFDTYWYDMVPVTQQYSYYKNDLFYCPDEQPQEEMYLLLDVENKRVCFISKKFYYDHWLSKDYDQVLRYVDHFFVNYDVVGNESYPFRPDQINDWIEEYAKLYADPEGAQRLREYAFGDVAKGYQNIINLIDWFYFGKDPNGWFPPLSAEEIARYIDGYGQCFNDPEGAQRLREYAFGADRIGTVTADGLPLMYNLQGQKTAPDKPGIYIYQGKKYWLK